MYVVYFFVGLISTALGAAAGLGGGVIIKPMLDLLGDFNLKSIGALSAITVFTMAVVSLFGSRKLDVQLQKKQSFTLAIGSIIGGGIGKSLFNSSLKYEPINHMIGLVQSALLIGILIIILLLMKYRHFYKTYHLKNAGIILMIGLILGVVSAFIGIGGGPLNIAVLSLLFSMDTKQARLNSIFIIFFSQLAAIILIFTEGSLVEYDLNMLPVMVIGGVVGGFIGNYLSLHWDSRRVELIFNATIILIIAINIYNVVQAI
ncbi:UPF0721 transmembrane protein [Halolactibacillus miurensis]|uniref:Probable membrane transporter protein n=1 Tax=Halolactibacillus miurensis TaxID=306541 RepID=A0A1I6NZA3_9BACI|nr:MULTISPECIES: sulfite exporter TauE/SafE family protein [Halolactibacillus]GEM04797.1 UPF0721 transmembrane protein [Halolactibacillus miurensis]SFS33281.1 hypothetical protein SAMN05421668_10190 [Halolactibacillus miurensis]